MTFLDRMNSDKDSCPGFSIGRTSLPSGAVGTVAVCRKREGEGRGDRLVGACPLQRKNKGKESSCRWDVDRFGLTTAE